jgi:hypothetical protein
MDREQIIQWAREAGVSIRGHYDETGSTLQELEAFAELVAAHEREACAKVCDDMASKNHAEHHLYQHQLDKGVRLSMAVGLSEGAAAIRARSNT